MLVFPDDLYTSVGHLNVKGHSKPLFMISYNSKKKLYKSLKNRKNKIEQNSDFGRIT